MENEELSPEAQEAKEYLDSITEDSFADKNRDEIEALRIEIDAASATYWSDPNSK